ncbi:MAG: nucleotidyltransferase [Bryobacterales bacterium]|nr:nucleotidyltransferase [Bryobacterales bacterium]
MHLSKDLKEFIAFLNSNKVDYLVVGALAVSWHGFPRYSGDVDFFVRPTEENAERLLTALRQFGFGGLALTVQDFSTPHKIVQLGREPNRIDLMTSISGISFEEAWESRVSGSIQGIPLNMISLQALLRNKAAAGRPKDKIDIDALQPKPED